MCFEIKQCNESVRQHNLIIYSIIILWLHVSTKVQSSSGLYNSVPDATAHFGIPECLHLLLKAIQRIIINKQSMYMPVALKYQNAVVFFPYLGEQMQIRILYGRKNRCVCGCCWVLLPSFLNTGGLCIVWRCRYLVWLGEVSWRFLPLCYNIMGMFLVPVCCLISMIKSITQLFQLLKDLRACCCFLYSVLHNLRWFFYTVEFH